MGSPFTFIDLFSGCGGFSLGLERARFRCLAAIDFNAAPPLLEAADWRERYHRSGWPVALVLIGEGTWRQNEEDLLSEGTRYCTTGDRAGLNHRHAPNQTVSGL